MQIGSESMFLTLSAFKDGTAKPNLAMAPAGLCRGSNLARGHNTVILSLATVTEHRISLRRRHKSLPSQWRGDANAHDTS